MFRSHVVVATTKVRIFKQITTKMVFLILLLKLLLLPQRYVFSSKSQPAFEASRVTNCCCCYHKGTYFQANHNAISLVIQVLKVVVATTKVRIFKQITTIPYRYDCYIWLLLLPQRYVFSSKSQLLTVMVLMMLSCCCYHKGTYFQANHNTDKDGFRRVGVVVATTKVRIFKQITTYRLSLYLSLQLLLLPQRYVFSSKSQPLRLIPRTSIVVVATTKVRIFKQITTTP